METKIGAVTKRLVKALECSGCRYALTGGFAAGYYGSVRSTVDIDVIISVSEEDYNKFTACIKKYGFTVDRKTLNRSFGEIGDSRSIFYIHFFKTEIDEDAATLNRSRKISLFGQTISIVTPEDLIVWKYKRGSDWDMADIKNIMDNTPVDVKYIEKQTDADFLKNVAGRIKNIRKM
jgi:hypothetical protein